MGAYGKSIRSGMCFGLLDGKKLAEKEWKKIMEQILQ
jgi:hypothetical protein